MDGDKQELVGIWVASGAVERRDERWPAEVEIPAQGGLGLRMERDLEGFAALRPSEAQSLHQTQYGSNLQRGMSRLSAFNPNPKPRAAEDTLVTRSDGGGRLRTLLEAAMPIQDRRHASV